MWGHHQSLIGVKFFCVMQVVKLVFNQQETDQMVEIETEMLGCPGLLS